MSLEYLTQNDRFLLMLLFAQDCESIPGNTWLQKEMFIIGRNIDEIGQQFEAHRQGPFSRDLELALGQFEKSDFIQKRRISSKRDEIILTDYGKDLARKVWESANDKERDLVSDVKELINDVPYNELIAFIYATYPELCKESDILDLFEKKRIRAATSLVEKGKVSLEKGSEIAGLNLDEFLSLLKERRQLS